MAQAICNEKKSTSNGPFRFNASAPEFVPRTHHQQDQVPAAAAAYFYPSFQYLSDGTNTSPSTSSSGSWIYVAASADQNCIQPNLISKSAQSQHTPPPANAKETTPLSDDLKHKIIKQAEYMFSDMSVLANESFAKHVYKDPEGYVPINFVTTKKKLKSLNVTNQMVAQALRFSSKLVVSNDGKKVKRKYPFTEREKEELQLRTVIAENLPDDHSHQNIEKLFNVVGSIKAIRICQPQEQSNSSRSSKGDIVFSNKLHALVEYENPETAEKAAEKLNDERNWRKGMRVRVMLKRSPKSVLKSRKSDFDRCLDEDHLHEDSSRISSLEASEDDEISSPSKKTWSSRAKSKHRPLQSARSLPTPSLHSIGVSCPGEIATRVTAKGPRMPDGTRGFTMGRGKPLTSQSS